MRRLALFLGFALLLLAPTSLRQWSASSSSASRPLRSLASAWKTSVAPTATPCADDPRPWSGARPTTAAFTDGYRTWIHGPNAWCSGSTPNVLPGKPTTPPAGASPTPTPTPMQRRIRAYTITHAEARQSYTSTSVAPSPTPTLLPVSDSSLAELAKASAWYRDGLDSSESWAFTYIKQIASSIRKRPDDVALALDFRRGHERRWNKRYL